MSDQPVDEALLSQLSELLQISGDPVKIKLLSERLRQLPDIVETYGTLLRDSPTDLAEALRKIRHKPDRVRDFLATDVDAIYQIAWQAAKDVTPDNPGDALMQAGGGSQFVASHADDPDWVRRNADKAFQQAEASRASGRGGARKQIRWDQASVIAWLAMTYHQVTGKHPTYKRRELLEPSGPFVEFCLFALPIGDTRLTRDSIANYLQRLQLKNSSLNLAFRHIYDRDDDLP